MPSSPADCLIVEIEGTLVDTRRARRAALAEALGTLGVVPSDDAIAYAADHRASSDAVAIALRMIDVASLDGTDVELASLRAERTFETNITQRAMLVPGARDALARLAAHMRLGVVTRMPRAATEAVLALAELEPFVRCVVTSAPTEPITTSAYKRARRRLAMTNGAEVSRGVALVDTATAADAARRAELRVVGVGDGARNATNTVGWLASVSGLTYDALMQILAHSGARTP